MSDEKQVSRTDRPESPAPRNNRGTGAFAALETLLWHMVTGAMIVSGLCILAILLIGVLDTGGRAFLNAPFIGAVEISEALLAVAIFFSLAYLQRTGGHVVVDVFSNNYGPRLKRVATVVVLVATLLVLGFLAWRAGVGAESAWRNNEVSPGFIRVPIWLARIFAFAGLLIACIEALRQLVRALAGLPPAGRGSSTAEPATAANTMENM